MLLRGKIEKVCWIHMRGFHMRGIMQEKVGANARTNEIKKSKQG